MFIPDLNDLCNYYDLNKKHALKFIEKANSIRFMIYIVMYCFELFFILFLSRCLTLSYFELKFNHFLFISLPLAVITAFSFHCLTFAILSMYALLFITQEFIKLRTSLISKKILNFSQNQKNNSNNKCIKLTSGKSKPEIFKIMRIINSILVQFEKANRIFDNMM